MKEIEKIKTEAKRLKRKYNKLHKELIEVKNILGLAKQGANDE